MKIYWKPLHHPIINDGYLISNTGMIRHKYSDEKDAYKSTYHSTNGYDYAKMVVKESKRIDDNPIRLFPIDEIIGYTFIPIPEDLIDKPKIINHINGDTRDISLDNLEWIEDIEAWRTCTYPGIKPNTYEISSWGNVKKLGKSISIYSKNNYHFINSDNKQFRVHRMVCWQFLKHDEYFNEKVVNHINGIPYNNHWKNLELTTDEQNNIHARITGLNKIEKNWYRYRDIDEINTICETVARYKGDTKSILKELKNRNINITTRKITEVKHKRLWKEVSDKYFTKPYNSYATSLKAPDVFMICKLLLDNNMNIKKTINDAAKYGVYVSESAVKHIRHKFNWTDISDKYF